MDEPVAYMLGVKGGWLVTCPPCTTVYSAPVFLENLGSYFQSCHLCGKTIATGKTPAWPQLFSNPNLMAANV